MAGMYDGVSKLWIVRAGRGLDVTGFKSEFDAIGQLVRCIMRDDDSTESKDQVVDAVAEALRHMDEDESPGEETSE